MLGTGEVPEIVGAIARDARRRPTGSQAGRTSRPSPTRRCVFAGTVRIAQHPESPSTLRREHRSPQRPADLHLRRRHAASPRDAAALRVRQDRRRLRLQVRVLHHPDAARPLPQPAGRLDRPRGAGAGGARREGAAAHLAGHDLLRHRPPRARRARPPAARAERGRRPRVDPPALSLSDDDRRRHARGDGRVRQGLQVHRPAAAARVRRRC